VLFFFFLTKMKTSLTNAQRHEICLKKSMCPNMKQADLVKWIEERFSIKVDQATVSRLLKRSATFLEEVENPEQKRIRMVKFPQVEETLAEWCMQAQGRIPLTDELITLKAKQVARLFSIPDDALIFSHGWLTRFKKRNNLQRFRLHGESGSVDQTSIDDLLPIIKTVTNEYAWEDIYNMDETGLFFRLEPDTTLATQRLNGKKKDKERLTIALCCNGNGTHKLMPFVIGKYANPRCFKNINIKNIGVMYKANKKAWMTTTLFQDWLRYFDMQMKDRQVLLLLDNAPCHIINGVELKHTTVQFLPPNTTSKIQPCDAGIISSFKAHYRKKFIYYLLERFDEGDFSSAKLNVLNAIYYIREAWQFGVTSTTILNCFRHTQIRDNKEEENITTTEEENQNAIVNEIKQNIETLKFRDPMDIEDFLNPIEETEINKELTIEEIAEIVGETEMDENNNSDDNCEDYEDSTILTTVAIKAVETVKKFLLQQNDDFLVEINNQENLLRKLKLLKQLSTKQTSIQDYYV
jgi:DDE superfamily endonuclease/Tc5 transposase DNA-binding domain/Fission yeast centromere protein N-terminal domain